MNFQAFNTADLPQEFSGLQTTIERLALKGAEFDTIEQMQALILAELKAEIEFLETFGKQYEESPELREAVYRDTMKSLNA